MGLDSIVSVSISANTANPSRAGFGVPGLIAYFPTSIFSERVRSYTSLTGMTDDGFLTTDPAYLMAVALKAQNPSPSTWKVCRKALPSSQSIRITPTITTEGEVLSITVQGAEVTYTIPASATVASICTALTALFAAIVGVTASDDTTHVTLTPKNVASAKLTVDGVANDKDYTVTIDGTDFTYTSDGSATATEIRDGLQALIIAGGYAAAEVVDSSTDALQFSFASHAGADLRESTEGGGATMALSSEVSAYRLLSIGGASKGLTVKDLTADPGIATDFAAIVAEDPAFYGVDLDSQGEAESNALAALVETQRMLFVTGTIDTESGDASTTTDGMSDKQDAAYARTATLKAPYNSQYPGCRWLGEHLPQAPGSSNWAYKTLRGLTVDTLTAAQEAAIKAKKGNVYITLGSVNVTLWGWSASGEWLDVTRGVDWFEVRLQERIYRLLITNPKISYGQAAEMFYAEIFAQMVESRNANVIEPDTTDTPWVITIPEHTSLSAAAKASRDYPGIEFSCYLAGAVNTLQITGTLS